MAESNLKTTEIGVKMDPRLMAADIRYIYSVILKTNTSMKKEPVYILRFHAQKHFDVSTADKYETTLWQKEKYYHNIFQLLSINTLPFIDIFYMFD